MPNVAIIVAAGKGTRMGKPVAKQFLPIGDCLILQHTLQAFDQMPVVHRLILVLAADDISYCQTTILAKTTFATPIDIVSGGPSRQDSVFCGLRRMDDHDSMVLIHDGVRPFVQSQQVEKVVIKAQQTGAAILALPLRDTLKRVSDDCIKATLKRKKLWMAQTPQVFRYDIIRQAHEAARTAGFSGTDDAQLVEKMGMPVSVVTGTADNLKITTSDDLALAEAILHLRQSFVS